jgi:predicted AlkP superfamily pyrophosphatase or phosphodiesterase
MGYISAIDVAGHKYGPDAPELLAKLRETDAQLEKFIAGVQQLFEQKMKPDDRLYVIFTTDHGMAPVHTLVHLEKLFESPIPRSVRIVRSGALALIYLDQIAASNIPELKRTMLRDLSHQPFIHAYAREDLPKEWGFAHPTRSGDIEVFCKPGYTFSERLPTPTFPVKDGPGPYGMHGYIPAECPEMRGVCIFWKSDQSLAGKDLGDISVLAFHPTVARILNIDPARGAASKTLPLR